jgi:hypothetical protein
METKKIDMGIVTTTLKRKDGKPSELSVIAEGLINPASTDPISVKLNITGIPAEMEALFGKTPEVRSLLKITIEEADQKTMEAFLKTKHDEAMDEATAKELKEKKKSEKKSSKNQRSEKQHIEEEQIKKDIEALNKIGSGTEDIPTTA